MNRAGFLDRNGVVNVLVCYQEQGIIDSLLTVEQLKLYPRAGEAIKRLLQISWKQCQLY